MSEWGTGEDGMDDNVRKATDLVTVERTPRGWTIFVCGLVMRDFPADKMTGAFLHRSKLVEELAQALAAARAEAFKSTMAHIEQLPVKKLLRDQDPDCFYQDGYNRALIDVAHFLTSPAAPREERHD